MVANEKRIKITCDVRDYLPIEALEVFQGGLKKRTDEDLRKIRESIIKHGFAAPFFVWRDNGHAWLLDGTGRYEALMQLQAVGYELPDLPVVYVHAKDEDEARELLLKITSRFGKVSSKGLEDFLKGLVIDFDGVDLGVFIKQELKERLGIVPEAPAAPKTKAGDLYDFCIEGEIRHRLLCGDAESAEAFTVLMGEDKASLVFTDPPYGVNLGDKIEALDKKSKYKTNITRKKEGLDNDIINDNIDIKQLKRLYVNAYRNMKACMKEDAAFYVCGGSYPNIIQVQIEALDEAGLTARHVLIWCKNHYGFSMRRMDYDYQHELIYYGWNEKHKFYGLGKYKSTLWNYDRPVKSNLHPTMKPPALIEEAIKNSMEPVERAHNGIINGTGKNDIVLDPFAGSGSTMAACENLKRRAFMIEISPFYCDVIVKRAIDINKALEVYRVRHGKREKVEW